MNIIDLELLANIVRLLSGGSVKTISGILMVQWFYWFEMNYHFHIKKTHFLKILNFLNTYTHF